MKIKIIGYVDNGKEQLRGIVDLPDARAVRLINLGAAIAADPADIAATVRPDSVSLEHAQKVLADQSSTISKQAEKIEQLKKKNKELYEQNKTFSEINVQLSAKVQELEAELIKKPAETKKIKTDKSGKNS